jgi:hypothetical protein
MRLCIISGVIRPISPPIIPPLGAGVLIGGAVLGAGVVPPGVGAWAAAVPARAAAIIPAVVNVLSFVMTFSFLVVRWAVQKQSA